MTRNESNYATEMSENATRAGRNFKLRDDGGDARNEGRIRRTNGEKQLHVLRILIYEQEGPFRP